MLDIIQYPFMQRAIVAGIILGILLALLGIFVVLKKMSFFSSGIAHASLAGVAIGIILSQNPLITALFLSILFAIIIYLVEEYYHLASDTTIGILFTSGMALGVLLISLRNDYQPELISFLFGNILSINKNELWLIIGLSIIISIFIIKYLKPLTLIALDKETAQASGVPVKKLQPALYISLAIAVVLGIKVLGIILVSALLIIPIATSKLIAKSFKKLIIFSIILSEITVISGIIVSYYLDLPTGPTIVLIGTLIFILTMIYKTFKK